MLDALDQQTYRLFPLIVVDNDPSRSAESVVGGRDHVIYFCPGENTGPAGGICHGLTQLPIDIEWVMLLDDDDPPTGSDYVEQLVQFLVDARHVDPACAAVGMAGSTFDRRSGRSQRAVAASDSRMLSVDWIGSNQLPIYSTAALRRSRVPLPELFWGFEELDIGLALRDSGHSLYRDGHFRYHHDLDAVIPKVGRQWATWRAFYTVRNLVHLMRRYSTDGVAVRVGARTALGRLRECPTSDRLPLTRLLVRALRDGWAGRLGRTFEPGA